MLKARRSDPYPTARRPSLTSGERSREVVVLTMDDEDDEVVEIASRGGLEMFRCVLLSLVKGFVG